MATYTLLEKITVGAAGASSVTFSSIPQTGYTDLVVKASARDTSGGSINSNTNISFNGVTTNRSLKELYGTGSAAGSSSLSENRVGYMSGSTATANTFGSGEVYIPNYTSSNYKSSSAEGVSESNDAGAFMAMEANLWSSTAAITSVTLTAANSFAQYSTFYLYGVAKLGTTPTIAPKATGGDTIMTDGTYWYHAFKASGTFIPATALSCDVLVVAGGGGGGNNDLGTGGGGAGGIFYATSQSISASTHTVTVGAGGAVNANGGDSVFGSLTTAIGGGRGATSTTAAGSQGSGGGGTYTTNTSGGTATSGQGSNGGTGTTTSEFAAGGGGGGRGAVGANAVASGSGGSGNGGAGTNTYSTWLSATGLGISGYIAGGGGGGLYDKNFGTATSGVGGSGGGGNGADYWPGDVDATTGTANTGGGGGGGGHPISLGAAGGSGVVIVRYAV